MFESFPHAFDDTVDSEIGTLSKLKRFFVGGSNTSNNNNSTSTSTNNPSTTTSVDISPSPTLPDLITPLPFFQSSSQPAPYHQILSNGTKRVRTLKLSNPSVTIASSGRGDLIQSSSARSLYNGSDNGLGISSSPNLNDSAFLLNNLNLSSIPGFPLNVNGGDDTKSIRSMSSNKPAIGASHIFRRLRGEVSNVIIICCCLLFF